HKFLQSLAQSGTAVLIVSQDLDELFAISSRIAVIAGGRLSPARPVDRLTTQQIGLAMGAHGGWEAPSQSQPPHAYARTPPPALAGHVLCDAVPGDRAHAVGGHRAV